MRVDVSTVSKTISIEDQNEVILDIFKNKKPVLINWPRNLPK